MKDHYAYLKYVVRHKWFVLVAGIKVGASPWRLIKHDWTKFLPCEWSPYVRYFYNPDGTKRDWKLDRTPDQLLAFNRAWNHHQKKNDHHWQSWLLVNDWDEPKYQPLEMPKAAVLEMVADWAGAGRAITGKWEVAGWYAKNRDKIMLHEDTRKRVETLLTGFRLPEGGGK